MDGVDGFSATWLGVGLLEIQGKVLDRFVVELDGSRTVAATLRFLAGS